MLYKKNQAEKLEDSLFKQPTAEYRGAPFWAWNTRLEQKELDRQMEVLKSMGFGGAHLHPRTGLETPYLSEKFMDRIKGCLAKAKQEKLEKQEQEELEKEKAKAINERKEAQKQKHYQLERRKNTVKLAAVLTAIPLAGAGVFAGINKVADKQPKASFVAHLSEVPDRGVALSDVNPLIAQEYLNYSLSQASEASRNSSYPQVQELYDRLYEYYAIPVYTAYYDYVDYQTMGLSVEQVAASLENYHTELNNYEGAITNFYGSIFSFGASPLIASIVKDGKVYVPDTGLKEPDEELDSDSFVINGTLYVPFKENKELRK